VKSATWSEAGGIGVGAALAVLLAGAMWHAPSLSAQEAVRLNRTIELLESGRPAFGVLSFDYSLVSARTLAGSDLDFVIIDMEHAPYDVERLQTFLLGMTDKRQIQEKGNLQMNVTPFVRVPATGGEEVLFQAKQVLDVGVFGVMYPSISTRSEAERAVRATRYPQRLGSADFEPEGLRGRNPTNAMWFWGVRDYQDRADVWPLDERGELLAILQIETPEGVDHVEDIVSVPGVGVIFIGPSDLTAAMGFPPGDEVEEAIQRVLRACLDAGVPCAITTSAGTVEQRIAEGFRFVTVGTDYGLSSGVDTALERGRAAVGR
jgi:4-hydroxy-2-oxoheptanedioate aldolase